MLNTKNHSCIVYDVRPSICRTFGTTHEESHANAFYQVCEYIPNSIIHERKTPNIEQNVFLFINLKTPDGQVAFIRPYQN
jgi:Fe-S-cluster containining protein